VKTVVEVHKVTDEDWWPFGEAATRGDPLTELRIAVTSSHPGRAFLVGFDRESEARPTDREAAQLRSYLDQYIDRWYNSSHQAILARLPLDVDSAANGVVFHKWAEGDWGYRRWSYTLGFTFTVTPPNLRGTPYDKGAKGPYSLERLMDRMHAVGEGKLRPRWLAWKEAHPQCFPPAAGN
jgi:hypothetical protein